jgi:hypothetical protein
MKLFLSLVATFILFTIVGTLTHELGHYGAAKYLGLTPILHYQSVTLELSKNDIEIDKIYGLYEKEIDAKQDFPAKKRYDELMEIETKNDFIHRAAGPIQTMLTGTIGFVLLIVFRKHFFSTQKLNVKQWLLIFFSLFWLRQVANIFQEIASYIFTRKQITYGDENILSSYLSMGNDTLLSITAIIGLAISCIIVFKFIPSAQRKIFIAAGFVGGIIGFVLWMYLLGPKLMP